ncbi:MAG: DUF58 domain-containing protein [Gammaproteobacteria bacterium]|nr:DUF58 domain-containing protein [Gammaproteobacteria bacterium]
MPAVTDKQPGISIDVDDLISLREHLSGLSRAYLRYRASIRSGAREIRAHRRGMEYEESRAYVPGDDVRTMDWRVMARTGEAYSKIFAEEKERHCLLAIDLSASMFFGTRFSFKSWSAAQVAAHAGWLASFAGDQIGGLVATPEFHHEIRPGRIRSGLLGVFHQLARSNRISLPPGNKNSRLNFLLSELNRVVKPGSIIALISDFIGSDSETTELLATLSRHNDISAYWIHDDSEINDWQAGRYQVSAQQRIVGFDLAGAGKDAWLSRWQRQHKDQIEEMTSQFGIPLRSVSCNHAVTPQIIKQLNL